MNATQGPSGPPFRSIHDLYHHRYVSGGRRVHDARQLEVGARLMLERSSILSRLPRARVLRDLVDGLWKGYDIHDEQRRQQLFDVFGLLSECYQPIVDDLLVMSAFEIHAKAVLLKLGYVIHQIRKPKSLRAVQSQSPVHVRSIAASSRRGEDVHFLQLSLGAETLLQPEYVKHYPLPSGAAVAVAEVRKRRNRVHFAEPFTWELDRNLIELVAHLGSVIPPIRAVSRRGKAGRA